MIGVTNTGPLLSAFQCNRTDLLREFFSRLYMAESQLAEFERETPRVVSPEQDTRKHSSRRWQFAMADRDTCQQHPLDSERTEDLVDSIDEVDQDIQSLR